LTAEGIRWVDALALDPLPRAQISSMLAVMRALQQQLDQVDAQLRQWARQDVRVKALCGIFGVGPIIACHLLAEIGDATRFSFIPGQRLGLPQPRLS
jgi:transposase